MKKFFGMLMLALVVCICAPSMSEANGGGCTTIVGDTYDVSTCFSFFEDFTPDRLMYNSATDTYIFGGTATLKGGGSTYWAITIPGRCVESSTATSVTYTSTSCGSMFTPCLCSAI